jgi:hypothetical protein
MANAQKDWAYILNHVFDMTEREAFTPTERTCLTLGNTCLSDICENVEFPMVWDNSVTGELSISSVEVSLPADCIKVDRVEWAGSTNPLVKLDNLEEMDRQYSGWRDATGDPVAFCQVGQTLYLSSYPGASTDDLVVRGTGYIPEFVVSGDLIDSCEEAWDDPGSNIAVGLAEGRVGSYCVSIDIASGFTTGILSSNAITSVSLADKGYVYATFWMKSSVAIADLSTYFTFCLDEHASLASSADVALPAMALQANTWRKVTITLSATQKAYTAAICAGLKAIVDPGTLTLYVDDVRLCVTDANPLDYLDLGAWSVIADYILWKVPADPNNAFEMNRKMEAKMSYDLNYPKLLYSVQTKGHNKVSY